MNATTRILVLAAFFLGAIGLASWVYFQSAPATAESNTETVESGPQPIDAESLDPAMRAGLDAIAEDRIDEAIAQFQQVPADSPQHLEAMQQLGVLYTREGRFEEAANVLLRLTAMAPDSAEAHALLGWVLHLGGRPRDAEISALRALELNPNHLASRYNIALYRVAQGRSQEAIASYIRAMNVDPNAAEIVKHRDRLAQYTEQNDEKPAPHYALAFFANSMQDRDLEIKELERFLELVSGGPEADTARERLAAAQASAQ